MLIGTWQVSLDEHGRLVLPAPIRPAFTTGMVITRGFERCLQLCPQSFWQGLTQRVSRLSLAGTDERWLRRLLFAEASAALLDDQAAIVISTALRNYAGLDRAAVVVGMEQYLEIWSPERWQDCQTNILALAGRWSIRDWDVSVPPDNALFL
ncbi:division/cell wall cluster transcriptional repressor MraZ [Chloroflexus sp.]|uniref:division/cell wall cluster transcriptional repressor MraZ n=1 Tax=Chloroflexus sp. TaxID=1904827 RepID=UPI00262F782F|nr:division/cell wall cluster transcriptional repressor MraZ [uncultured Chloroflexus sp.]